MGCCGNVASAPKAAFISYSHIQILLVLEIQKCLKLSLVSIYPLTGKCAAQDLKKRTHFDILWDIKDKKIILVWLFHFNVCINICGQIWLNWTWIEFLINTKYSDLKAEFLKVSRRCWSVHSLFRPHLCWCWPDRYATDSSSGLSVLACWYAFIKYL